MASLTARVFQSVGRHFLTLSCVQRLPKGDTERIFVFSGFLVSARGQWFCVTAGHILRDIRLALEAGYTFDRWRLDDQTAGNEFKGMAVPYAFDIDEWLVIENEEVGLDYAALPLQDMYRLLLAAGGADPIDETAWGDHITEHDHWVLVGIPKESVAYDGETVITARVVMALLVRTDTPSEAGVKSINQFYGKLQDDPDGVVHSIDGMSGGPIFGLKCIDGRWKYQIIGVQSSWYAPSRVIAACPFSSFGLELTELVSIASASLEDSDTKHGGAAQDPQR